MGMHLGAVTARYTSALDNRFSLRGCSEASAWKMLTHCDPEADAKVRTRACAVEANVYSRT